IALVVALVVALEVGVAVDDAVVGAPPVFSSQAVNTSAVRSVAQLKKVQGEGRKVMTVGSSESGWIAYLFLCTQRAADPCALPAIDPRALQGLGGQRLQELARVAAQIERPADHQERAVFALATAVHL